MPPDLKIYLLSADTSRHREEFTRKAKEVGADGIFDKLGDGSAILRLYEQQVGKVVALVDDNDDTLQGSRTFLQAIGARNIHLINDPQVAVEQIPILRPDVVFSDVTMPRIDGFELTRRLREAERQKQT